MTVGIEPRVAAGAAGRAAAQRAGGGQPRGPSRRWPSRRPNDADPVVFQVRGLAAGTVLLVRVQVDGAESPLTVAADGTYDGPKVTVP